MDKNNIPIWIFIFCAFIFPAIIAIFHLENIFFAIIMTLATVLVGGISLYILVKIIAYSILSLIDWDEDIKKKRKKSSQNNKEKKENLYYSDSNVDIKFKFTETPEWAITDDFQIHKDGEKHIKRKPQKPDNYICPICKKSFETKKGLHIHQAKKCKKTPESKRKQDGTKDKTQFNRVKNTKRKNKLKISEDLFYIKKCPLCGARMIIKSYGFYKRLECPVCHYKPQFF
ncbi:MAG: hypothetical protein ABEK36_01535 [Candidatus Aenigmatarchaeota archaeon]